MKLNFWPFIILCVVTCILGFWMKFMIVSSGAPLWVKLMLLH